MNGLGSAGWLKCTATDPDSGGALDVRTLCLACHPDLPRNHEQKPGSVYRECLRCHVEIHGSQSDPDYLR